MVPAEFVAGSRLAPRVFPGFPGSPGFPEPSTKTNTPNFDSKKTEDLHENQFRLTWLSFKIYNLLINYLFIVVMIKHICEDEQNKFIPR